MHAALLLFGARQPRCPAVGSLNRSTVISHRKSFRQHIADIRDKEAAMKRAALSVFLVLGAAALGGTFAGAHPNGAVTAQAAPKKQKVLIGFYKNRTVNYFDYGRIKLRPGNKLAPIWVFSNGADGQHSIVDSAPGDKQYSALHKVTTPRCSDSARRDTPGSRKARRSTITSSASSRSRRATKSSRSGPSPTASADRATSPMSFPERPRTRLCGRSSR